MSDLAPTQPATSAYHFPDFSKPPFAAAPEARFEPLPADAVLPEGFFSTSNLPTYIKLNGRWIMPARPRMDCVVVRRGNEVETIEPRRLRRGDLVAMARRRTARRVSWSTPKDFWAGVTAPTSSDSCPPR
jgi:hypothetical protein